MRFLFIGAGVLIALIAPAISTEPMAGASGDLYKVYDQHRIWRAVGPALSIRYRTHHLDRAAIETEAKDLLPMFAARADSADVRYLIIRATRPIGRVGQRFGVYRAWNFRYERARDGWVASGYW